MKIFIGADHRGYKLKSKIIDLLGKLEYDVVDVGTHTDKKSCDYPKISYKVASNVVRSKDARGILVCMTGIGHCIAANKVSGANATLCYNRQAAKLSREHNDSNILVLGARFVPAKEMEKIIRVWLKTKFEGGRHLRRIKQIRKIEKIKRK